MFNDDITVFNNCNHFFAADFFFCFGNFSLSRNPKSKIMISWFLASMAVTIWSLGFLLSTQSPNETVAFYTLKIVYLALH
jgi:hypothetical protein